MKMKCYGILFMAFCAAILLPAPLAAELETHWYQPRYLPSVEDASDQLKLASPHFSPCPWRFITTAAGEPTA